MIGKDKTNPWGKVAPKSGRVKMISELIDSMVMPGIQGGPLMHIIAAKAVAFGEALRPEFKIYIKNVVSNAKTFAEEFLKQDYNVISGGTDTHLILIDLSNKNITGKIAEKSLENAGITVNKNMVPFDTKSPFVTSGIRIGTPAITTRGMGVQEMKTIARMIDNVLSDPENEKLIQTIRHDVNDLCNSFPLYNKLRN
jgi:glycine hydroxymethyltransferase